MSSRRSKVGKLRFIIDQSLGHILRPQPMEPDAPTCSNESPATVLAPSPGRPGPSFSFESEVSSPEFDKLDIKTSASASLKLSLIALSKTATAVPSLKSAVDALTQCIDIIPAKSKNQKEYEELAASTAKSAQSLEGHLKRCNPGEMNTSVDRLINELHKQVEFLNGKRQRLRLSNYTRAEEDLEDLMRVYRSIEESFRQLQSDAILNIWRMSEQHLGVTTQSQITINQQFVNNQLDGMGPVKEARYDSAAAQTRRTTCTPNTRTALLKDLAKWATNPDGPRVYWMNGMAGTGKTTIACSLCHMLKEVDRLGASFFCSRALPGCRDADRIIPTISYQFARYFHPFFDILSPVLASDPDICTANVVQQFKSLLVEPLQKANGSGRLSGLVVVIDALDECLDRHIAQLIVDALFQFISDIPIKFFVTCRPEPWLFPRVLSMKQTVRSMFHLHDIEQSLVQSDIEIYLKTELATIHPSEEQIKALAKRSGTLFIYAATVSRYIRPLVTPVNSRRRLISILDATSEARGKLYEPLDALYTTILSTALENPDLEPAEAINMSLLLNTILCAQEPLSVSTLSYFLNFKTKKDAWIAIEPLRSVLYVSDDAELVTTLHISFPDYMLDHSRSKQFWINSTASQRIMLRRCLNTMGLLLKFNICNLEASTIPDKDVPGLPEKIKKSIPEHLSYACKYWGEHLINARTTNKFLVPVADFLSKRVLFWVETMNLMNSTELAVFNLSQTYSWLKSTDAPDEVCEICQDAWRFVTIVGANPVCISTPHIYVSMLALWDRNGALWKCYGHHAQKLISAEGLAITNRRIAELAQWRANSRVSSVIVSPNGDRVVSGSHDGTLQVWNAFTGGSPIGPLQGHTPMIHSLALASDGICIAASYGDYSIRVWDIQTGIPITIPLEGHRDMVTSLAFSNNARQIASGSRDCSIRIWDISCKRSLLEIFCGHGSPVNNLTYSSDGRSIISGHGADIIRVWNSSTGSPIVGPPEETSRVARFQHSSFDGSLIVSGFRQDGSGVSRSYVGRFAIHNGAPRGLPTSQWFMVNTRQVSSDLVSLEGNTNPSAPTHESYTAPELSESVLSFRTRIPAPTLPATPGFWNVITRTVSPMRYIVGHARDVTSVAYSPDGSRIFSGSLDRTIRVWDAQARYLFEQHSSAVTAVCFSPNGVQMAAGYEDGSMYLWDPHYGTLISGPFRGSATSINCLCYSPDSLHIASCSSESSINIWNVENGQQATDPLDGHTDSVWSVAYSSNGFYLVSCSSDRTIRMWDTRLNYGNILVIPGHEGDIFSVGFSPDATRIVSGSEDTTVGVWILHTGELLMRLKGHERAVSSVQFSPEGEYVISSSEDCTVRLWDAYNGHVVAGPFVGHTDSVWAALYSPVGHFVVSGSQDGSIRIWDIDSGDYLTSPITAHSQPVSSISFSPDGSLFASGSLDGAVRIWDTRAFDKLAKTGIKPETSQSWVLNKDGWIITEGGLLLFWVPPDLRSGLVWPQNVAVIRSKGTLNVKFEGACIGPHWAESFIF